jgi:EAL and modified HD-GYP domain-containing signal transduction protein
MSVQAARADHDAVEKPREVLISRQPVVDREMRVTGYRVSYASAYPNRSAEPSATRLFGDVLSVVGLEELVGGSLAHLPVSRELLLTLGIPPVRPDRVMLRVTYETAADPEIREILDGLASRGYALSVYELPGPDVEPGLLELFGTVEVDFAAFGEREATLAVKRILAGQATPLAVGVPDHAAYEAAKTLGFVLFTGKFFSTPKLEAVRDVPVTGMNSLVSLVRLQGDKASIEELERVIDHDVGLSVKLLRYINSAYFGLRSNIGSIKQAVMMLGARGVSRWALMIALTGSPSTPRELAVTALTRARMCELLGVSRGDVGADELFTIGLLSVADVLLDRPLATILADLPLADGPAAALLRREGSSGAILQAVIDYEVANFGTDCVQAHKAAVGLAYMDALRWAQETLSAAV